MAARTFSSIDVERIAKMLQYLLDIATSYYGKLFILDMGIQWVGFLFATKFKTEKFYDLTGETH